MAHLLVMMMILVVMELTKPMAAETNDLDYGFWNYREGTDNVNVASVRSLTRVLDVWGKRIFNEVKNLLHSQPSSLLPDYSRVRPLSESLNDLFREVSLLQRRITELTNRLATLEPFLRRYGYHDDVEGRGDGSALGPQSARGGGASLARYPQRHMLKGSRPTNTLRQRGRVKVIKKVPANDRER